MADYRNIGAGFKAKQTSPDTWNVLYRGGNVPAIQKNTGNPGNQMQGQPAIRPENWDKRVEGNWNDSGTQKGLGWQGTIPVMRGRGGAPVAPGTVMSELSVNSNIDGFEGEHLYPLIHPFMSADDLHYLSMGGTPTEQMHEMARDWAAVRIAEGKSPFRQMGEEALTDEEAARYFDMMYDRYADRYVKEHNEYPPDYED